MTTLNRRFVELHEWTYSPLWQVIWGIVHFESLSIAEQIQYPRGRFVRTKKLQRVKDEGFYYLVVTEEHFYCLPKDQQSPGNQEYLKYRFRRERLDEFPLG